MKPLDNIAERRAYDEWLAMELEDNDLGARQLEFSKTQRDRGINTKAQRAAFQIKRKLDTEPVELEALNELVAAHLIAIGVNAEAASRAARHPRESNIRDDETRPLTIKERVRGVVEFSEAKKRGEIPADAELPARLRASR